MSSKGSPKKKERKPKVFAPDIIVCGSRVLQDVEYREDGYRICDGTITVDPECFDPKINYNYLIYAQLHPSNALGGWRPHSSEVGLHYHHESFLVGTNVLMDTGIGWARRRVEGQNLANAIRSTLKNVSRDRRTPFPENAYITGLSIGGQKVERPTKRASVDGKRPTVLDTDFVTEAVDLITRLYQGK